MITEPIQLEGNFASFAAQLRTPRSPTELREAITGLQERIEQIREQIESPQGRDEFWQKSARTALKYYQRKCDLAQSILLVQSTTPLVASPPKKVVSATPSGVLATFAHKGDFFPMAARINVSELAARLMAESVTIGEPSPVLIGFVHLTEAAAALLPEAIWFDEEDND